MFLTDRKLQRRMDEVKKYRYRGVTPIGEFLMCEDEQKLVNPRVPVNFDGWGRIAGGECWAGRDRYLWMHRDIRIQQSGPADGQWVSLISEIQVRETTVVLSPCAIWMRNPSRVLT